MKTVNLNCLLTTVFMITYLQDVKLNNAKIRFVPTILTVVALIGIDYVYLKLKSMKIVKYRYQIVALSLTLQLDVHSKPVKHQYALMIHTAVKINGIPFVLMKL